MRFNNRMTTRSVALVLAAGALGSLSLAAAGPAAADVVEPFGKRYDASLYGDFTTVGNTVMGCPTTPADQAARCATAADGRGGDDNDAFAMTRIDTASMAAGYGSSTGRVEIPAGAEVSYARLFWGGNDGTYQGPDGTRRERCDVSGGEATPSPGDPATTAPRLRVGSGAGTEVSIDSMVTDPEEITGPHYYTGESDVTAAFAEVPGGATPVAVGNVWAANGPGCVAGWSLTVVYAYPGPEPTHAPDRRRVYVYGGHVLQRPTSPATTVTVDGFHRTAGRARAAVTAYDGDRNTPGDMFLVNGEKVTVPTGGTDGFFVGGTSGAVSPDAADSLGIDARSFDLPDGAVPDGADSADLTFRTAGDAYVPSALAFSVPVRDPDGTRPTPTPTPTPARTEAQARPAAASVAPSGSPSPTRPPAPPTPVPDPTTHQARPPAHGPGGSMAETGGNGERLWLLGGLALALAATGAVAKAAMRSRHQP
ncbi:hypothetical protein AB0D99_30945 [Streptomyces sp. NPDC047971]|uniref:hypothetical protein n=1 Tax=Streptomyces sp. NPDC047971 TaxID=3154499 RepID=UPI0033EF16FF